ncbi:MAG TPA: TetR/AcrR family transcriptional regulator [Polyangia bacterium]|jgi:AcrR family transcriptional regulator
MPRLGPAARVAKFDRRLDAILAAAAREFADAGYDHATIRDVARRARVSIAGLYYYVGSKEELLYLIQFHVFDSLVSRYVADSAALADPRDRLRLFVRNHLEHFLGHMAELIVCSREIDRLRGDFRARVEAKQREYFGHLVRVFDELAPLRAPGAVEPRTAALALFGTMNWVHTWYRPTTGPSAAALAEDVVKLYLHGVLPAPRPA